MPHSLLLHSLGMNLMMHQGYRKYLLINSQIACVPAKWFLVFGEGIQKFIILNKHKRKVVYWGVHNFSKEAQSKLIEIILNPLPTKFTLNRSNRYMFDALLSFSILFLFDLFSTWLYPRRNFVKPSFWITHYEYVHRQDSSNLNIISW